MEQLEVINRGLGDLAEKQDQVTKAYRRNENTRTALEEHYFQRERLFQELKEMFQVGEMNATISELDSETSRYQQQLRDELLEREQQLKKQRRMLEAQEDELYRERRKAAEEAR